MDPFVADPELTAADGLHPSDAGYLAWYRQLLAQTDLASRLAASVSYTHLRAHETVLDLVCRLLLEKKKT